MTKWNTCVSDEILNNVGYPQGSVLGPQFSVQYVSETCKIHFVADDTLIYFSEKDHTNIIAVLNNGLKIYICCAIN